MSKFSPTAIKTWKSNISIIWLILWFYENAKLSICDILYIVLYNNQRLSRSSYITNLFFLNNFVGKFVETLVWYEICKIIKGHYKINNGPKIKDNIADV